MVVVFIVRCLLFFRIAEMSQNDGVRAREKREKEKN
jgi:hypothetical protein